MRINPFFEVRPVGYKLAQIRLGAVVCTAITDHPVSKHRSIPFSNVCDFNWIVDSCTIFIGQQQPQFQQEVIIRFKGIQILLVSSLCCPSEPICSRFKSVVEKI
ncbi:hypothetical protein DN30_3598 [Vibrio cholerae]|nr:hypothetical protein DN30_3598 [Vibrio cholerae]